MAFVLEFRITPNKTNKEVLRKLIFLVCIYKKMCQIAPWCHRQVKFAKFNFSSSFMSLDCLFMSFSYLVSTLIIHTRMLEVVMTIVIACDRYAIGSSLGKINRWWFAIVFYRMGVVLRMGHTVLSKFQRSVVFPLIKRTNP